MKGLGLLPLLAPLAPLAPLAMVATAGFAGAAMTAKGVPPVGATVTVSRGRLTVHAYEQPAAVPASATGVKPGRGHEFGAIDVEACNDTSQALALNPYQFSLELADHARVHPAAVSRTPALDETSVGPTACVRGWITFEVRRRVLPSSVVFQSGSASNRTLRLVRWRITKGTRASTTGAVLSPKHAGGGDPTIASIWEPPGRTPNADRGAA
jgi:hypothetical protein